MPGLRFLLLLIAGVFLVSCSAGMGQLEKSGPQPVDEKSLVRPPWETLVKAGPGAEKDIDYETLNGVPDPNEPPPPPKPGEPLPLAADDAQTGATPDKPAPVAQPDKPAKPGTAINAVAVLPVTGDSPQGAQDLTKAMRKVLTDAGWPVIDAPRPDALVIRGNIKLDPAEVTQQAVHISWNVTSPKGKVLGSITQNNDVPAHTLDGGWGDNASNAAQAAADGIFKLIAQYR